MNLPARTALGLEVRKGFVASDGCVLASIDYSQIEMVYAAHLSQDAHMMDVFVRGEDIHTRTVVNCIPGLDPVKWLTYAQMAGWEEESGESLWESPEQKREWKEFKQNKRMPMKTTGFGVLYGQKPEGAQANIVAQGGPLLPLEFVTDMIDKWFTYYSGVRDWMELQYSRAKTYGMVWDIVGRIIRVPEAQSTIGRVRSSGLRQAGNGPIQASAQATIKLAMWALMPLIMRYQGYRGERCWPLLQIHDELIFELSRRIADEFMAQAKGIMSGVVRLSVPLGCSGSTARTWGELK